MTAAQMKYEFEVGYDFITNFQAPGLNSKEISTFLTKAQEELLFDLYRGSNHYTEEFKKSLSKLKTSQTITGVSIVAGTDYPSSYVVDLASNVLVVFNESVDLQTGPTHFYASKAIADVAVKPVDDDYYHANKQNPFKCPNLERVWRLDSGATAGKRHIYIVEPLTSVVKVIVHYYKKPAPIVIADSTYISGDGAIDGVNWSAYTVASSDCELDAIMHRQIIDRAIKLAYAAVKDQLGFEISAAKEKR